MITLGLKVSDRNPINLLQTQILLLFCRFAQNHQLSEYKMLHFSVLDWYALQLLLH